MNHNFKKQEKKQCFSEQNDDLRIKHLCGVLHINMKRFNSKQIIGMIYLIYIQKNNVEY